MRPKPRLLIMLAVLALVAVTTATLAKRSDDEGGPAAEVTETGGFKSARSPFQGALRPLTPPHDFALPDQDGRRVSLRSLRGKIVVLSPMYTICRDTCPIVAQQISAAIDDLSASERRSVVALALSVDPANDTPARARRFLAKRHVDRNLDFLLGDLAQLRPIWKAYGFARQTVDREHNSYVVLIDRHGRQRVGFPVDFLTPEALGHDLRVLMRAPS